jgi:chromosome segregation protein
VETLRLSQLAEQTRARSEQISADLAEVEAQLADLQERRVTAEARFEELDMQLADSQERHAQLGDRVIEAERASTPAASSSARWSASCRRPVLAAQPEARRAELTRAIDTAASRPRPSGRTAARPDELARLSDAAAQGGLQQALGLKLEREKALAAQRSNTTT